MSKEDEPRGQYYLPKVTQVESDRAGSHSHPLLPQAVPLGHLSKENEDTAESSRGSLAVGEAYKHIISKQGKKCSDHTKGRRN